MPGMAVNFPQLFFNQVEKRKDVTALRHKEYGIWKQISWTEYGELVKITAAGLVSLGIQPGDRVAILGDNRPEWPICHLATMSIGGATCGVYPTSAAEQVAYVIGHSEARILFAENEEQVDKVLQILPRLSLARVVVWDTKGLWGFSHEKISLFEEFLELGRQQLKDDPDLVDRRRSLIKDDDTAMIIYTSGTTGPPKGGYDQP